MNIDNTSSGGNGFDDDGFGVSAPDPAAFARVYRDNGFQVVPAGVPGEQKAWKQPIVKWKPLQHKLVSTEEFDVWYGPWGRFANRPNMGMVCGACSGNVFIIDLDLYKSSAAATWWRAVVDTHMDPETVEQVTGGGGVQKLFRAPPGWVPPTCKTSIGVDIRGQGGFAMLPPSLHESGDSYRWREGCSPADLAVAEAEPWLCDAIDQLVLKHGGTLKSGELNGPNGQTGQNGQMSGLSPLSLDAFGKLTDGREDKMKSMIWRVVVNLCRTNPIMPDAATLEAISQREYEVYERGVGLKEQHPPGLTKTEMLDRERGGRGKKAWDEKWRAALRQWNGKVMDDAGKPDPVTGELPPDPEPVTGPNGSIIQHGSEFVKGFVPPDYLIDGMVQKGYLYSVTGPTGHGKTPVTMLAGARVATGRKYQNKEVSQGSVLFLAGENPTDIRARFIALAEYEKFDIATTPFYFLEGVVNIKASMPRIREAAAKIPNLSLVIIDTDQAYFMGEEGNSNEQRKAFARDLRELLTLPGKPAALVNCHPTKNAGADNLVPMGGSSFLNEVDGNITCWAEDRTTTIKPHGTKWRGVPFEEMSFELKTVNCESLKDTKGRYIPSVLAAEITEQGAARRGAVAEEDEKRILRLMHAAPNASMMELAARAEWFMGEPKVPAKSRVQRVMARLLRSKFVYKYHGEKCRITKKGAKHVQLPFGKDAEDDDE